MGIISHVKQWNIWRKRNTNGPMHKLLVLFKIVHSPTFYSCGILGNSPMQYTVPEKAKPEPETESEEEIEVEMGTNERLGADVMTNRKTLDKFKEVMRLTNEDILFWVPNINGSNTIKVRLKDYSELIFTYNTPKCWKLESAESYIKSLKKERIRKKDDR